LDVPDELMQMIQVYQQGQRDANDNVLTQQAAMLKLMRDRLADIGQGAGQKVGPEALYDLLRGLRADIKGLGGAMLLLIAASVTPEREGGVSPEQEDYARSVLQRGRE